MSDRDQLRQAFIDTLRSDEWMARHLGIVAHADDVADALLPVVDAHVQAELAAVREAFRAWSGGPDPDFESAMRRILGDETGGAS